MLVLRAFALLILATLLLAALLTPFAIELLEVILAEPNPYPFSRVYNRVAMLVAACLVICFRQRLALGPLKESLKAFRLPQQWGWCFGGALLTLISGLCFLWAEVRWGGILVWREGKEIDSLVRALQFLPAALFISIIEEGFFRVIMFQSLKERFSLTTAALLSSLVYALVHFISPVKDFRYTDFDALAGLRYVTLLGERYLAWDVCGGIFGLLLVGMLLALVFERSRSLPLIVGLHAGWVVVMKFATHATDVASGVVLSPGLGKRYVLIGDPIGWSAVASVGFVLWGIGRWVRRQGPRSV